MKLTKLKLYHKSQPSIAVVRDLADDLVADIDVFYQVAHIRLDCIDHLETYVCAMVGRSCYKPWSNYD